MNDEEREPRYGSIWEATRYFVPRWHLKEDASP